MLLNSFKILKDRQRKFGWHNRRKAQQEKISIIIPVYNESKNIAECIESIKKQTYTNIEIIIVDDGSTDDSLKICEEIAKKDTRIALLSNEKNMGVANARNVGLEASTGEFIMFVDGDDLLDRSMLELMKRTCDINRADIGVCDVSYLYDGDIRKKSKYANGETEIITGKEFDMCYFLYPDMQKENISVWNKLYRAELFADVRFPEKHTYSHESTVFKLTNSSERIAYIHEPLYISRVSTKDVENKQFTNEKYGIFDSYMDRLAFYEQQEEYDMMWYTLKRCMYRFYEYKNAAKAANCYEKKYLTKYSKDMKTFYKRNKGNFNITSRDKKQIALFFFSFPVYCKIKDLQG